MKGGLLISLMRAKRNGDEDGDEYDGDDDAEAERAARDVRSALEEGNDAKLAKALRYFIEQCG